MNLGWLLLVLGLALASTEASCCWFDRIWEVAKHEPRPDIHMEMQFKWACMLGVVKSLGSPRQIKTVLASLMESQIWH